MADVLSLLARMTGDLRADTAAAEDELEALRFLIASDLQSRADDELPEVETPAVEPEQERWRAFLEGGGLAAARERVAAGREVVRIEPHTAFNSLPFDLPAVRPVIRNLVPDRVMGPFSAPEGLLHFFDIFLAAERLTVQVAGETRPLFVLTSARRRMLGFVEPDIDLEPGTVWIRADALVPGAPSDGYVGLRVSDGKLTIGPGTSFADGVVTVSGAFTGKLTLDLEHPKPAAEDLCEDVQVKPPQQLEITWNGGVSIELGGGASHLYGETFEFEPTGTVSVDGGQLIFGSNVTPVSWDAGSWQTPVARLRGVTALKDAGWAVPLTLLSNPAGLGQAVGDAGWRFRCVDPIEVQWLGGPRRPGRMDDAVVLMGLRTLAVLSLQTHQPDADAEQVLRLWDLEGSGQALPLRTNFPSPFPCLLGCDDERGEYVAFLSRYHPVLDLPVDAMGRPIEMPSTTALTLMQHHMNRLRIQVHAVGAESNAAEPAMMVLENAYLAVNRPSFMGLAGTLSGPNRVSDGLLATSYSVNGWMPTLPDPYVTNLMAARDGFGKGDLARGRILGVRRWRSGPGELQFIGLAASPEAGQRAPTEQPAGPARDVPYDTHDSQTVDGSTPATKQKKAAEARARKALAEAAERAPQVNAALTGALQKAVAGAASGNPGALLLDVSTKRHQIGVALTVGGRAQGIASHHDGVANYFGVRGMSMVTPLDRLRVFTLPLVQWEPVRTLDVDQDLVTLGYFPTPLASADDGGPTIIGTQSQELTASIPEVALDAMVEAFDEGTQLGMVTTLPFGLKAGLVLQPADTGPRKADSVSYTMPRFETDQVLDGGLQLTLKAEGGRVMPATEQSPSFTGATAQLLNGVDLASGAPLGISVLGATSGSDGSVETMFNNEFAAAKPRVPLTRYDVSGYGGTTFSDWQNPRGAFAEATKVQFQLMVGRTALEIIKFASVLYPWGVKVTRSVTIERRGGGGVIRRDSGWQASSPGLFDFRHKTQANPGDPWVEQPSPFTVHPGLIEGIFDVERIRPASEDAIDLPSGGRVLGMRFDADVALDGLPDGKRARVEGMVGYLHVLPVGLPITAGDLQALLTAEGAVGGPIDIDLSVGDSAFRVRALRAELDVAEDGGAPVLVGAVKGTPYFGPSGSWSVIRQPGPSNAMSSPEGQTITEGTPLIRSGAVGVPSDTGLTFATARGAYRFAEAVDLFQPSSPQWELGFLQTTPTHAFLYRRPHIESGDSRIRSTLHPCFADLYARSTSQGLFPAVENTIQLTDQSYQLLVDGSTGHFRLHPAVHLHNPRPVLSLSDGPDRMRLFYDDATLSLDIDHDSWSVDLSRIETWNDMGGHDKTSGLRMNVIGGTHTKPQLTEIETLLDGFLEDLLSFMPGMDNRGVQGPVDLSATNLKVKVKVVSAFEHIIPLIPSVLDLKLYGAIDVGSETDESTGETSNYTGAKIGADLRGRTPTMPWFFVYGCGLELGGKTYFDGPLAGESKPTFEAKLYVGFGYGGEVGPFSAKVTVGMGPIVQYDSVWKCGGFLFFEAKVDLVIAMAKVFGEFGMLLYEDSGTNYVEYQGEVGISVHVCWIIYIKMSVQIVEKEEV